MLGRILSAGVLATTIWTGALMAADTVAPGDIAAGARDYRAFGCAACHGTTGAGGGWQGPRIAPEPLPLEAFAAQLREPVDKMPRYSAARLTDRQIADMHAFLSAIRPGKSASEIEMLNR